MNKDPLPQALIMCPSLGLSSEIWVDRQLRGFQRISPTVACWENHLDPGVSPPCPVASIPNPRAAAGGAKRWRHRLHALTDGKNFVGAPDELRRELTSLFERVRPSVVLCHFGQTALLVLPVAQRFGVPVVAHFHGQDLSSALRRDKWYRWSLLANLRRFSAVVVVGSQQRDWVAEQGVEEERLHIIPCGAPVKYFTPPQSRPAGPFHCVAVSRLVPWKGLDHSLRAFATLKNSFPEATFSIIGDGDSLSELESLADALGIREATRFTGPLPPEEVRREFERADVFVQHSLNHPSGWVEGFGVSIAEASATGLPVVVSHCGGIIDQVLDGETGFVIPQQDDQAMAGALVKLAADPALRKKMGEAGRKRVVENFDTETQIRKLEEVLLGVSKSGWKQGQW